MTEVLYNQSIGDESSMDNFSTPQWSERSVLDRPQALPYSDLNVAVIGMSCKFPGADCLEHFWDILETGSVQCRDLPNDRFPDWRFERRGVSKNFKANTIDDIDAFDHKFFKVASREAKFMDPQQRLALQLVYQALESAGYFSLPASDREQDMGCYFATSTNEYHENVASHPPSAFSLTGSLRPFIAGKVSHYFGWTGPAVMFDTACSGSATAIHHACRAVASGDCTTAVAGATNLFVSPDTFQELAAGHFLSSTGASKSFDAAADGYCRGEGVAFVVLKRLSAALRDGDPIRGIIASTAIGQNAGQSSITIPHGPSQMSLYRKALRLSGLNAQDISYIEGHGTGTPVGDPIEAESIRGVFGNSSPDHYDKTYLGSVKSIIGHTEASSGIAALIKVLLMQQKEIIPQQALFNTLNPAIGPLEPCNIEIPKQNVAWATRSKNVCVNNYGASGTNTVMIVTQAPDSVSSLELVPIRAFPISITAFSASSLSSYCSALLNFVDRFVEGDGLKNIAYHLSRRRNSSFSCSLSATVSSLQELKHLLSSTTAQPLPSSEIKKRPMVLFFSGQTGNMTRVPRAFYDSFAVFRKHLNDCDAVLSGFGAPSIFPDIFESGPCQDVVLSHSLLFSGQYASAMAWIDCGLQPARLIGHSFGQLTALCVSGVLSLHDSLLLVTDRAKLIAGLGDTDPGSMIAVEAEYDRVSGLLSEHADLDLEIACYNGPQSFVLAGRASSIDAFQAFLASSAKQIRWKRLNTTHAFHSALTDPIIEPLRDVVQRLCFHEAKIPLETCSQDGTWQSPTPDLVAAHTREPVYFHQAVERISDQFGPCTWLEAGSGSGVGMLRRALESQPSSHDLKSVNFDSTAPLDHLARVTSELWKLGLAVQFWAFHKSHQYQYAMLNLPPYQFDKTRHWLDYQELAERATVEVQSPVPEEPPLIQLVRKIGKGGEFRINTRCDDWRTTCTEHKIFGMSICPVSMLLDLVSRAVNAIPDTPMQMTGNHHMHGWKMPNPISADIETGLSLMINKSNLSEPWEFTLSSALNAKTVYASGTVFPNSENAVGEDFARFQRLVNIKHVKHVSQHAEADLVKGKAVYKILADCYQIPKPRHRISEVSIKGDKAVGYLQTQTNNPLLAIEDFVHVPLICLNSLRERQDDEVHVPTAVGQTRYRSPSVTSEAEMIPWAVYAKFFESEDGAAETTCDIFVFDTRNGQLSATILDVVFTRMQVDSLRRTLLDGGDVNSATQPQPQQATNSHISSSTTLAKADPDVSQGPNLHSSSPKNSVPTRPTEELPDLADALFDLFVRVADVERDLLSTDVVVFDLGIDSLMGMEVAEEINNFFSVKISVEEFAAATDLGSLCQLIANQTTAFPYGPKTATGSKAASEEDALHIDESVSTSSKDLSVAAPSISEPLSEQPDMGERKTSKSLDTAVLRAFDAIRTKFDDFARVTGCDKFWSDVYPVQSVLVATYILEAFSKLELDLSQVPAGAEIPEVPHVPKYDKLLVQLMRALRDEGLVTENNKDQKWIRTSKPVPSGSSAAEQYDRILTLFPHFAPEHKLLDLVGRQLDACLMGKVNPVALLFGSAEKRQLMADQYTIAPMQSSVSQQLAAFITEMFSSPSSSPSTPPQPSLVSHEQVFRVLEIGGGTCGTSVHAVSAFSSLPVKIEYTFTDISPSFVTAAAKTKLSSYNFIKYHTLDITSTPVPSDLVGRFDMIIATNVMHATRNARHSATNARLMLKPGTGFLVLIEYTRPLYIADVIFGQLDGWWYFDDGRDHAIMDTQGWERTLKGAGFGNVDWSEGRTEESRILRMGLAY